MCNSIAFQPIQNHLVNQLHLVRSLDYQSELLLYHHDNGPLSEHTDTFAAKIAERTVNEMRKWKCDEIERFLKFIFFSFDLFLLFYFFSLSSLNFMCFVWNKSFSKAYLLLYTLTLMNHSIIIRLNVTFMSNQKASA